MPNSAVTCACPSDIVFVFMASMALVSMSGPALGQTRAGTPISNMAQAAATAGGTATAASSNLVTFLVAERLDVTLVRRDRPPAPAPAPATSPGTPLAVAAILTNAGNGSEAFALTATGTAGLTIRGIAIDTDGDGVYDPTRDTLLTGGITPALDPSAAAALLVLVDGSAPAATGASITLVARAVTGSGAPGTLYPGVGDGGGDAVVGATGAQAQLAIPLALQATAAPVLTKSQMVLAPDGSERAIAGAIVTYTLLASFSDARPAVRIDDPVPAGTRYVAGSLTLDGAALTDAADGDAGGCDGTAVTVSLGDIATPPSTTAITHVVRFQAVLQ